MTEFLLLSNLDDLIKEESGGKFDVTRKEAFEEHLRNMGIEGV